LVPACGAGEHGPDFSAFWLSLRQFSSWRAI
jgi:hypothetical protein